MNDAQLPEHLALRCSACGASSRDPLAGSCPAARPGDDVDHVLVPPEPVGVAWPEGTDDDATTTDGAGRPVGTDPFVHYRRLLYPYRLHRAWGGEDAGYLAIVEALQQRIERLDGRRFHRTPLRAVPGRDLLGGRPAPETVWVKDETGNVSGSHKGRHLFGLALQLAVVDEYHRAAARPAAARPRLAISSCGNAALAAAVVAAAAGLDLEVFVPPAAPPSVLARLDTLGAAVTICRRSPGERGDPCFTRFVAAVAAGALPFAAQGPQHGLTLEGAATLGYELADQLRANDRPAAPDRLYLQVGGGALAAAVMVGLRRAHERGALAAVPALVTVQTESAAPLARAHRVAARRLEAEGPATPTGADPATRSGPGDDAAGHHRRFAAVVDALARRRSDAMWPWEHEPSSIAGGILDDETYDWRELLLAMDRSGGHPVVVSEALLAEANERGRAATGIDADPTGTAGLAGLYRDAESPSARAGGEVLVVFSGHRR